MNQLVSYLATDFKLELQIMKQIIKLTFTICFIDVDDTKMSWNLDVTSVIVFAHLI